MVKAEKCALFIDTELLEEVNGGRQRQARRRGEACAALRR